MNMIEKLDMYEYVRQSTYRNRVLSSLYGDDVFKTPTQIAKEQGIRTNHISKVLSDLKNNYLIKCINENRKKGRLYCLTNEGHELCDYFVDKQGFVYFAEV